MREATRVNVVLDGPNAPLHTADRVALVPDGVLGASALEIIIGPDSASPLQEHATLAAVPPDSVAVLRDAIVRAVAKEAIDQWRRPDSGGARGRAAPRSQP